MIKKHNRPVRCHSSQTHNHHGVWVDVSCLYFQKCCISIWIHLKRHTHNIRDDSLYSHGLRAWSTMQPRPYRHSWSQCAMVSNSFWSVARQRYVVSTKSITWISWRWQIQKDWQWQWQQLLQQQNESKQRTVHSFSFFWLTSSPRSISCLTRSKSPSKVANQMFFSCCMFVDRIKKLRTWRSGTSKNR